MFNIGTKKIFHQFQVVVTHNLTIVKRFHALSKFFYVFG